MGKRKLGSTGKDEPVIWTPQMDDVLIDAYAHQNCIGNRVGGTFTSKAYDSILNELSEKFPAINFDKEKIKNHMKYIKRIFGPCYDIFKNGLSGFTWNSATSTWCAEPEVWEKLIEAHPEAAPWMNKPVRNYQKLVSLFGNDRATGENAETAAEVREKNARLSEQNSGQTMNEDTIDEIDFLISQRRATLEGYNLEDDSPVEGSTSNKKQKIKKVRDDDIVVLKDSFKSVADAIKESTAQLVKSHQRLQIPENEIWYHLEELQIDEEVKNDAYLFLTDNPSKLGAFLGCPVQSRRAILSKMLQAAKNVL